MQDSILQRARYGATWRYDNFHSHSETVLRIPEASPKQDLLQKRVIVERQELRPRKALEEFAVLGLWRLRLGRSKKVVRRLSEFDKLIDRLAIIVSERFVKSRLDVRSGLSGRPKALYTKVLSQRIALGEILVGRSVLIVGC